MLIVEYSVSCIACFYALAGAISLLKFPLIVPEVSFDLIMFCAFIQKALSLHMNRTVSHYLCGLTMILLSALALSSASLSLGCIDLNGQ